jgi:hypothetical protein
VSKVLTATQVRQFLNYNPKTGEFTWKALFGNSSKTIGSVAGTKSRYVRIRLFYKFYLAHRLAYLYMTGVWPDEEIDHINGDGLDNRWSNLRPATHTQNMMNSRKRMKNGLPKGVSRHKRSGKYQAHIRVNKESISLGLFTSTQTAHIAYALAAKKHFGDFARVK